MTAEAACCSSDVAQDKTSERHDKRAHLKQQKQDKKPRSPLCLWGSTSFMVHVCGSVCALRGRKWEMVRKKLGGCTKYDLQKDWAK